MSAYSSAEVVVLVAVLLLYHECECFLCPSPGMLPHATNAGSTRSNDTPSTRSTPNRRMRLLCSANVEYSAMIPGTWSLESSLDDGDISCFLNFNENTKVSLPPGASEMPFPHDRASWKLKGTEFAMELGSLKTGPRSLFFEKAFIGKLDPEGKQIVGTVMYGETDPEYVGKFTMKQIMGSLGAGSGGDAKSADPSKIEWNGEVNEDAHHDLE